MQIRLNENTTFAEYYVCADELERDANAVRTAWQYVFGHGFWELSLDEFCDMAEGRCDQFAAKAIKNGMLTMFGWLVLQDFKQKAAEFGQSVERLSPPATSAERLAAESIRTTLFESMVYFAREFFGMHSFREASEVTLNEWMMARKAQYVRVMTERAVQAEMRKKYRTK